MIPPEYVRRYATVEVASVERGRLLLLVLEGGEAFLARARGALVRGDVAGFVADLGRTQDVVLELVQTLDHPGDGEVAASLGRLHERMVRQLARANVERSLALVDELLVAYGPIVDAYRQVVSASIGQDPSLPSNR
jgi:flagellar protein FliS